MPKDKDEKQAETPEEVMEEITKETEKDAAKAAAPVIRMGLTEAQWAVAKAQVKAELEREAAGTEAKAAEGLRKKAVQAQARRLKTHIMAITDDPRGKKDLRTASSFGASGEGACKGCGDADSS